MGLICALITAYIVVLVGRAIMSWFPIRPDTVAASIYSVLRDLTEPVLAPLRRAIPPAGMLDLSSLIVLLLLFYVQRLVCG